MLNKDKGQGPFDSFEFSEEFLDAELEAIINRGRTRSQELATLAAQEIIDNKDIGPDYDSDTVMLELVERAMQRANGASWGAKLDSGVQWGIHMKEAALDRPITEVIASKADYATVKHGNQRISVSVSRVGAVSLITAGLLASGLLTSGEFASAESGRSESGAIELVTVPSEELTSEPVELSAELSRRPFEYRVKEPVAATAVAWDVGISKGALQSGNPDVSPDKEVQPGSIIKGEVLSSRIELPESVHIKDIARHYGVTKEAVQSVNYVSEEGWIEGELFVPGRIIVPVPEGGKIDYPKLANALGLSETGRRELIRINERRLNGHEQELPLPSHVAVSVLSIYPISPELIDLDKLVEIAAVPDSGNVPIPAAPIDQPVAVLPNKGKDEESDDAIIETAATNESAAGDLFDPATISEEDWIYEESAKSLFPEKVKADGQAELNDAESVIVPGDAEQINSDNSTPTAVTDTNSSAKDDITESTVIANTMPETPTTIAPAPESLIAESASAVPEVPVQQEKVAIEREATPEEKMKAEIEAVHAALDHMVKTGGDVGPLNHLAAYSPLFKAYDLPQELQDQGFRYLPPANTLGLNYEFSKGAPDRERIAHHTTLVAILAAAYTIEVAKLESPEIYAEYKDSCLRIGDLSADEGHKTHHGNSVDLSSAMQCDIENGRDRTDGPIFWISRDTSSTNSNITNSNHSAALENLVLLLMNQLNIEGQPLVKSILYNRDIGDLAKSLRSGLVRPLVNHSNHIHMVTYGPTSPQMKKFGAGGSRPEQQGLEGWIMRVGAEYLNGGGVEGIGKGMTVKEEVSKAEYDRIIDVFTAAAETQAQSESVPEVQPSQSQADTQLQNSEPETIHDGFELMNEGNGLVSNEAIKIIDNLNVSDQKKEFLRKMTFSVSAIYMEGHKINPSVMVAQAILETGWGTDKLSKDANNYFGVKAGSSWNGDVMRTGTTEEYSPGSKTSIVDAFRSYASPLDSIRDQAMLIQSRSYYQDAVNNYGSTLGYVNGLIHEVDDKGNIVARQGSSGVSSYATDRQYVSKIMSIIENNKLEEILNNQIGYMMNVAAYGQASN